MVDKRSRKSLFSQTPIGSLKQEVLYLLLVLFRLQTACAVDQNAAGFEKSGDALEDLHLKRAKLGDAVRLKAPSHIYTALHHAGVGAGNIDQNPVEQADLFDLLRKTRFCPIMLNCLHN